MKKNNYENLYGPVTQKCFEIKSYPKNVLVNHIATPRSEPLAAFCHFGYFMAISGTFWK